jgi:hypothetical protein
MIAEKASDMIKQARNVKAVGVSTPESEALREQIGATVAIA